MVRTQAETGTAGRRACCAALRSVSCSRRAAAAVRSPSLALRERCCSAPRQRRTNHFPSPGPAASPSFGWAAERPVGPVLAAALQALLALDDERRQIADEVLGLYREVNLLYELAETLTRTAGRDELASRMLAEVTRLVDADSAMVVIEQDGRQTVGAHLGHDVPPPAELDRARIDDDGALLVAPLSVGDERHGAIILRRSGSAFSAADAKLLGAVAAQAAGVLERVLEEERRAAAAAARERRLQEQIAELRIELDERRQAAQVAQITETEYYGDLRLKPPICGASSRRAVDQGAHRERAKRGRQLDHRRTAAPTEGPDADGPRRPG